MYQLFRICDWLFKPEKQSGEPAQVYRFLGLEIDSRDMTFNISKEKLEKIKEKLEALMRGIWKGKRVGVRKVAQVVGLI